MIKKTWMDNICKDGDKAWFVAADWNALFEYEKESDTWRYLAVLPDYEQGKVRLNSKCFKWGNDIICFPIYGNSIWVFDLNTQKWNRIEVDNPDNKVINMYDFWEWQGNIYTISRGLNRLFEIDVNERKIITSYTILEDESEKYGGCVKVQDSIYVLAIGKNCIYEFLLKNKYIKKHSLNVGDDELSRITYDGEKFWISSWNKAIYAWNRENGDVRKIEGFPKDFGEYDYTEEFVLKFSVERFKFPAFLFASCSEKYVWFIPHLTNEIVYVDKSDYKVCTLDVPEEEGELGLLNKRLGGMYALLYHEEDSLALFSYRNCNILEINTSNLTWKYREVNIVGIERWLEDVSNLKSENCIFAEDKDMFSLSGFLDMMR